MRYPSPAQVVQDRTPRHGGEVASSNPLHRSKRDTLVVKVVTSKKGGRGYDTIFDYHVNYFDGVVEMGVDNGTNAEEFGIQGGGIVFGSYRQDIEQLDPFETDPDYRKLTKFIMEQAAVGKKIFPEPTPPQMLKL